MITAEIRPDTFVPVELLRWTRDGKVQVRYRRMAGEHSVWGMFFSVPAMRIIDSAGRDALARTLARLPQAEAQQVAS